MVEIRMGSKITELAGMLARRIKEDDSELVMRMGSYLSGFSTSHIEKLYKSLIVGRRRVE